MSKRRLSAGERLVKALGPTRTAALQKSLSEKWADRFPAIADQIKRGMDNGRADLEEAGFAFPADLEGWEQLARVIEMNPGPMTLEDIHKEAMAWVDREMLRARLQQQVREERTAEAKFVCQPEDLMILLTLDRAGCALTLRMIASRAAAILRGADGLAVRASGIVAVGESKVAERLPLLIEAGLVVRPLGPGGRPTVRKGVGITPAGRQSLPANLRLTHV